MTGRFPPARRVSSQEAIESLRSEFTANLLPRSPVTRLRFDVQTQFDLVLLANLRPPF